MDLWFLPAEAAKPIVDFFDSTICLGDIQTNPEELEKALETIRTDPKLSPVWRALESLISGLKNADVFAEDSVTTLSSTDTAEYYHGKEEEGCEGFGETCYDSDGYSDLEEKEEEKEKEDEEPSELTGDPYWNLVNITSSAKILNVSSGNYNNNNLNNKSKVYNNELTVNIEKDHQKRREKELLVSQSKLGNNNNNNENQYNVTNDFLWSPTLIGNNNNNNTNTDDPQYQQQSDSYANSTSTSSNTITNTFNNNNNSHDSTRTLSSPLFINESTFHPETQNRRQQYYQDRLSQSPSSFLFKNNDNDNDKKKKQNDYGFYTFSKPSDSQLEKSREQNESPIFNDKNILNYNNIDQQQQQQQKQKQFDNQNDKNNNIKTIKTTTTKEIPIHRNNNENMITRDPLMEGSPMESNGQLMDASLYNSRMEKKLLKVKFKRFPAFKRNNKNHSNYNNNNNNNDKNKNKKSNKKPKTPSTPRRTSSGSFRAVKHKRTSARLLAEELETYGDDVYDIGGDDVDDSQSSENSSFSPLGPFYVS